MQLKEFSVTLGQLITEFKFEIIYGPEGFEKIEIILNQIAWKLWEKLRIPM